MNAMTLNEAKELAKQGKRITRDSWGGSYMTFGDSSFWLQDPHDADPPMNMYDPLCTFDEEEEQATDWREWTEKDDRS